MLCALIIDDDRNELNRFNMAMEELGLACECLHVTGFEKAGKILSCIIPSSIFIDYGLPKKAAVHCLQEIRKLKALEKVPVVVLTDEYDAEVANRVKVMGATQYVQKPFDVKQLSALLKSLHTLEGTL